MGGRRVKSETERYLELLDRRIGLLGTLAESLVQVRKDIVSLDVNGLEARISEQEQLCRQVGALDGQLDKLQEQCATSLRASAESVEGKGGGKFAGRFGGQLERGEREVLAARLNETRERMRTAQGRVKQLNATHQELLRRCKRTAGALLNMYGTFEATYAEPMHARQPARGRV
jgi:hypothetical protein